LLYVYIYVLARIDGGSNDNGTFIIFGSMAGNTTALRTTPKINGHRDTIDRMMRVTTFLDDLVEWVKYLWKNRWV